MGFEMLDRGIARQGHDIYAGDVKIGTVTSGTQTPYLKKAIGMGYVPLAVHRSRHRVRRSISAAGASRAQVVPMPFYKRKK